MQQFFEFAVNHWVLVSILAALGVALMIDGNLKAGPKVSNHEATALINRENALVLDIREKADFKSGHLVDALNIPQSQLINQLETLGNDKNRPIIVVCKTGQTASIATKLLKDKQFTRVYRLAGGMLEWKQNNLPVVTK